MKGPAVSVIMPAYNHAPFVVRAMESVYSQTFDDYEFLILDDGSTDGTQNAIHSAMRGRTRFFCHERNMGACRTLNELLDAATGEFVALINSDDEFLPTKLERQIACMRERPEIAACFTWAELTDENGEAFVGDDAKQGQFDADNATRQQWLKRLFFTGNCLCHPTLLARRKLYTLRYDERLAKLPDMEMWVRLLMEHEIYVLNERLTRFRILDGRKNASAATPETLNLIANEMSIVLDNYLRLSKEDAAAVFDADCDPVLRGFAACMAAIKLSPVAAAWGLRNLYKMLGDPQAALRLESVGFTTNSLISLASQFDVYGELPITAKLYYADARDMRRCPVSPFSEERTIPIKLGLGDFSVKFPLLRNVAALRFDPCEQPCTVALKRAELNFSSGTCANLIPHLRHSGKESGGEYAFDHADPHFTFVPMAQTRPEYAVFEGRIKER